MSTLVFSLQEQPIFEFKMSSEHISIGRSDTCDVALPGEGLSRHHCHLQRRGPRWLLVDRSKHGTFVNGQRIQRAPLSIGDRFELGPYSVELTAGQRTENETTAILSPKHHEFVVACDEQLVVERAVLRVLRGPDKGQQIPIVQMETTIGSGNSQIALQDASLKNSHCVVSVSRGRPMITPMNGTVFLEGQRLQTTTPIYEDDVLVIGQTEISVSTEVQSEPSLYNQEFGQMIGSSYVMLGVFGRLTVFAAHDFPVLIVGESGTGKELAARGIHDLSTRSMGPFVPINCGSIPENLLESELFGHEKGAFSGAVRRKDGAFHQAEGGTLFLDELGELPLSAQAKLLRVLESGEVRRVGAEMVEFPNVRIVAATNRDLHHLVEEGLFREDLLFRLQVLSVSLPPLRERVLDIEPLARHLLQHLAPSCTITEDAVRKLKMHDWPGNIRELRNVLTRAFVLSGGMIDAEHIEVYTGLEPTPMIIDGHDEGTFLRRVFKQCGGNKSKMSRELGLPRTTLIYKLKRFNLI